MAAPDPNYDILAALQAFAPGVVLTRDIETALAARYQANGFTPLTQAQVLAIAGPLPVYPSGLIRLQDSNPSPFDDWSTDTAREVGFA